MSSLNMFNMGGPQHRPNVNHRIPELLESLKAEFESLAHDVNVYKIQRDDYERTRILFILLQIFNNFSNLSLNSASATFRDNKHPKFSI